MDFRSGLVERLASLRRFAMVLSRSRTEADDLVQATCERALLKASQFQAGTRFESWLFAIMHSIWKNELRRRSTAVRLNATLSDPVAIDGQRLAEGKIFLTEVLSKLSQLPIDQATALSLVSLEGLTYREAADVLEVPIGTLESRVARARISLGRSVGEEGGNIDAKAKQHRDGLT